MLDLYFWPTGNGKKVVILLEECGIPYTIKPINIGRGDQLTPDFLKISPNGRMPAIIDHEPLGGGAPISIFESGAIMTYLAEKTGRFCPSDRAKNTTSPSGSAGSWAIKGPSSASTAIFGVLWRLGTTAIFPTPSAALTMRPTASLGS
jgi:GSH-dependent disulfide-bond oxidoreductase